MNQKPLGQERGSELLRQVHEGMTVYDAEDDEIGEVEEVYLGAVSQESELDVEPATVSRPYIPGEGSLLDLIAEVFDAEDMPEEVAERLLRSGFIRVESSSLFGPDRYVTPDQIASVSGDSVRLRVSGSELIEDEW